MSPAAIQATVRTRPAAVPSAAPGRSVTRESPPSGSAQHSLARYAIGPAAAPPRLPAGHVAQSGPSPKPGPTPAKPAQPAKPAPTPADSCGTDVKAIDDATATAGAWRKSASKWLDAHVERVKRRFPRFDDDLREPGPVVFGELRLLDQHFRISEVVRERGGHFPWDDKYPATGKEYATWANSSYDVRQAISNVQIGGLTYNCEPTSPKLGAGADVLGSAVPGSRKFTVYRSGFDQQSPEGQAGVVLHEAFHASFSGFSGDSYSFEKSYPGTDARKNADSYATFASIVATGQTYRIKVLPTITITSSPDAPSPSPGQAPSIPNKGRPLSVNDRSATTTATAPTGQAPSPLPPIQTFKQLWPEFVRAQFALDVPKATALAKQLATAPYDFPDLLEHGIELVTWLDQHGEPAAAKDLLDEVRRVWLVEFVSRDSKLPTMPGLQWNTSDPGRLITLGQDAARGGRHDVAFQYLGVANEILSYYAMKLTERRAIHLSVEPTESGAGASTDPEVQRAIREAQTLPRMIGRMMQYSSLKQVYDEMRRIYSVYPRLEREAIGANDQKAAAAARAKTAELKAEIKRQYTWGSAPAPGSTSPEIREPVEIAEVSYEDTPRGPGLTLHGANDAETTLTPLPGLPSPKEIGNDVQVQNLASLQEALMAQVDFQAEIGRVPEIRTAFGDKVIDMNDTATRQKVWLIMFKSFAAAGPSPLGALMGLVGRYLKAYTIHTQYNVRDWGVSYLDSTMPTDLAGRAERDCGVYALTVAWDIYQTAKRGDASLDLAFDLVTMLEHVTLIITDRSAGEFFMVNNDVVSGPHKGTPDRELSSAYGGVRQLPYAVGPSVPVQIGTTKDAPKTLHDQAWTRYKAAVDWGLAPRIPPAVEAIKKTHPAEYARLTGELQKARYDQFYRDQKAFSEFAEQMDRIVDGMGPLAGDQQKLGAEVDKRIDGAGIMIVGFASLGPGAGVIAGSPATQAILPKTANYLYTLPPGRTVHPVARFAMAILRLHRLGRGSTQKETDYLTAVGRIADFKAAIDRYQQAGSTGPF